MVRLAVVAPCVRCFKPTPSVATEVINWGDLRYELKLCQKHHMQLEKEIRAWTNLGELIDETAPALVMAPVPDELQSRPPRHHVPQRAERLHIPVVKAGEEVQEDEDLELWRDELPQGVREMASSIPELSEWRLSRKAREDAGHAGIDILALMMTAVMPEDTAPSADGDPDIKIHIRGSIRTLVSLSSKTVITVFRRGDTKARVKMPAFATP